MISILMTVPSIHDATSYYRAAGPFSHLRKSMKDLVIKNPDTITWAEIAQNDAVFILRPHASAHSQIIQMAKDMGKPVWVDFDDDLLSVPQGNPIHSYLNQISIVQNITKCATMADVVTVSTKALANKFAKMNRNTFIVPNALNTDLLKRRYLEKRENVVLWRGSNTHDPDLHVKTPEIAKCVSSFPGENFYFLGNPLWWTIRDLPKENVSVIPPQTILEYFKTINNLRPKVMQVPLLENEFNKAKSNICHLEASYAGALTVAPAWDEWMIPGVVNYTDDYFSAMKEALEMSELQREKRVQEGWDYIAENLTLDKVNVKRHDFLEMLLDL